MLDEKICPMLAYAADPFDSARHLYEIKWDGSRCLLFLKNGTIRLQNRRLENITHRYPELSDLPRFIQAKNAILDGELVVLRDGLPDFPRLQQREQAADPLKISLLARKLPATYVAFDLLFLNDAACLSLPLRRRKALLREILRESACLVESRYIHKQGVAFFREAVARGLEGIMAKNLASPYLIGKRSRYWLKIKPRLKAECRIVGFTPGEGARAPYFGALLVAARREGELVYRGRVGSGFSTADLEELTKRLRSLETAACPLPRGIRVKGARWVRPELAAEIHYQELTPQGRFRAPVFKRVLK